jgi:HD-GYP domain-containing protein (c-di-GMP phosphodiesterase class II)
MPPGSQYRRHLLTLVAVQTGCVALACWIYSRQVVSAAYGAAEREALASLSATADELLSGINRLEQPGSASGGLGGLEGLAEFLRRQELPPGVRVDLVDPQWRIVTGVPEVDHGSLPRAAEQETLTWAQPPDGDQGHAQRISGLLVGADGRRVGVARRLKRHDGYLVAHCRLANVKTSPAALVSLLPAAGVITWVWASVPLLIAVYIIVTRFCDGLVKKRAEAETAALSRAQSLLRAREAVIFGLAKLAESRDHVTGSHLERISAYTSRLAHAAQHHAKYANLVTTEFVQMIATSSALHDIGKVGIEDAILFKPGPLTKDEQRRCEQHTVIGEACLGEIERRLGTSNFLAMARQIAGMHHERWDGRGYPQGLAGEQIPLAARIVAIADVYEALSSQRAYKRALSHEQCVRLIRQQAGKQFDPGLVEVFLEVEESFRQIAGRFRDAVPSSGEPAPEPTPSWEAQLYEELVAAAAEAEDWLAPTGSPSQ